MVLSDGMVHFLIIENFLKQIYITMWFHLLWFFQVHVLYLSAYRDISIAMPFILPSSDKRKQVTIHPNLKNICF